MRAKQVLWAVALVLAGCGKKEDGGESRLAPANTAAAQPAANGAASAGAKAEAKDGAAKPAAAHSAALAPGRTPVPTLAEWADLKTEVMVKGSSALNCETKIIREYLRVSCKGKNDKGGTPKTIQITKGGREALTFAAPGVMSLIVPFVEGTDFEAKFSWSDKSHPLSIKWPKGAKKPAMVGVFEGAASPLDGTAAGNAEALCTCFKKVTGSANCEGVFGGADADCDRTYGKDCQSLLACAMGEPGKPPACLPGFVNVGPMFRCRMQCGPGKAKCPTGFSCSTDESPDPVCLPD